MEIEPIALIMTGMPVDNAIAAKVGMPSYTPPKPGYAKTPCDVCGELLWLGPKQQAKQLADRERWVVLCVKCVVKLKAESQRKHP